MESCRNSSTTNGEPRFVVPCNAQEVGMIRSSSEMPKQSPFGVVVGCSDAQQEHRLGVAKATTKLSAQDRVILFCVATGIDHASVGILPQAMQSMALRGFIEHEGATVAYTLADSMASFRSSPRQRPWAPGSASSSQGRWPATPADKDVSF